MATFGKTVDGDSYRDISINSFGTRFTCPTSGTVTKITVYLLIVTGSMKVTPAILDTSNTVITNGTATERTLAPHALAWTDFTFAVNPSVVGGTEYGLFVWAENTANQAFDRYLAAGPAGKGWFGYNAAYPNYAGQTYAQGAYSAFEHCIYVTYTETGGGPRKRHYYPLTRLQNRPNLTPKIWQPS